MSDSLRPSVVAFLVLYSSILGFLIFYPLQLEEQARVSRQVLQLHTRIWPGVAVVALPKCHCYQPLSDFPLTTGSLFVY